MLEICVDSIESAIAAAKGGAERIEVCFGLIEGGLTPSHGLLQQVCREITSCKIMVLNRPRPGDFVYTENEFSQMKSDVLHAADLGVNGVVAGFLTPNGEIDTDKTSSFVELCSILDLDFTFHRAFDVVRDQLTALSALIGCGVKRVLTSGGCPSAFEAIPQLSALVSHGGAICIMAGGGINEENVETIVRCTGIKEIHGTFRSAVPTRMQYIHPTVTLSSSSSATTTKMESSDDTVLIIEEERKNVWQRWVADEAVIHRIKMKLDALAEAEEEGEMG